MQAIENMETLVVIIKIIQYNKIIRILACNPVQYVISKSPPLEP